MKSKFALGVLIFISLNFLALNCSNQEFSPLSAGNFSGSGPVSLDQANVLPVTVGCGYVNEPCVTVTVCAQGSTNCQTIPNVLLDTGSYGLRLFNQVSLDGFNSETKLISLPLEADPNNANNVLTECVSYGDGAADWGPIAVADVKLNGETAKGVPIQIVNSTFGSPSGAGCTDLDTDPMSQGFNGILGVGLFVQDCGSGCAPSTQDNNSNNGVYFSCPAGGGGTCTGTTVSIAMQVANPVSYLPVDNNGVVVQLPSVASGPSGGATGLSGYLVLGIGTESNNVPTGTKTLPADVYGNFITVFNGSSLNQSFIDSGSNALYFPGPTALTVCSDGSFYCPTSESSFSATQQGATGTSSEVISFNIGNADNENSTSNPNVVFSDIGGPMSTGFDWGLPFFFGRSVFVGMDTKTSSLGAGPLWSY